MMPGDVRTSEGHRVIKLGCEIYTIAASERSGYLQQHEEGMQQQQDHCVGTAVMNFRSVCRVVAFFIVNNLKKRLMLPKYRKEFITPQKW